MSKTGGKDHVPWVERSVGHSKKLRHGPQCIGVAAEERQRWTFPREGPQQQHVKKATAVPASRPRGVVELVDNRTVVLK